MLNFNAVSLITAQAPEGITSLLDFLFFLVFFSFWIFIILIPSWNFIYAKINLFFFFILIWDPYKKGTLNVEIKKR